MAKKKVSIIIPLYNSEKYVKACVESVLSQSYRELELIIVDDGSIDGSLRIAKQLQSKDNRILVYTKKNGGASSARNYGLLRASGEYLLFLDSDDMWYDEEMLMSLVTRMESQKSLDFVLFNGIYKSKNKQKRIFPKVEKSQSLSKQELFHKLIQSGAVNISPCMRIIKTQFLLRNKIFFIEGIINEDVLWSIEMISKCRAFDIIDSLYYVYNRDNIHSVTKNINEKEILDCIYVLEQLVNKGTNASLLSFAAFMYVILLFNVSKIKDNKFRKQQYNYLYKYRFLLKYNLHPKVRIITLLYNALGFKTVLFLLRTYDTIR